MQLSTQFLLVTWHHLETHYLQPSIPFNYMHTTHHMTWSACDTINTGTYHMHTTWHHRLLLLCTFINWYTKKNNIFFCDWKSISNMILISPDLTKIMFWRSNPLFCNLDVQEKQKSDHQPTHFDSCTTKYRPTLPRFAASWPAAAQSVPWPGKGGGSNSSAPSTAPPREYMAEQDK